MKVAEDRKLQSLLEYLYQPNSRSQFLFQGSQAAIDLDSALKIEIPEQHTTKYTLILDAEFSGGFSFSNLVLTDRSGESEYMIMKCFPADDFWQDLQGGIISQVEAKGGSATSETISKNRVAYEDIVNVLKGTKSISELGCK